MTSPVMDTAAWSPIADLEILTFPGPVFCTPRFSDSRITDLRYQSENILPRRRGTAFGIDGCEVAYCATGNIYSAWTCIDNTSVKDHCRTLPEFRRIDAVPAEKITHSRNDLSLNNFRVLEYVAELKIALLVPSHGGFSGAKLSTNVDSALRSKRAIILCPECSPKITRRHQELTSSEKD